MTESQLLVAEQRRYDTRRRATGADFVTPSAASSAVAHDPGLAASRSGSMGEQFPRVDRFAGLASPSEVASRPRDRAGVEPSYRSATVTAPSRLASRRPSTSTARGRPSAPAARIGRPARPASARERGGCRPAPPDPPRGAVVDDHPRAVRGGAVPVPPDRRAAHHRPRPARSPGRRWRSVIVIAATVGLDPQGGRPARPERSACSRLGTRSRQVPGSGLDRRASADAASPIAVVRRTRTFCWVQRLRASANAVDRSDRTRTGGSRTKPEAFNTARCGSADTGPDPARVEVLVPEQANRRPLEWGEQPVPAGRSGRLPRCRSPVGLGA